RRHHLLLLRARSFRRGTGDGGLAALLRDRARLRRLVRARHRLCRRARARRRCGGRSGGNHLPAVRAHRLCGTRAAAAAPGDHGRSDLAQRRIDGTEPAETSGRLRFSRPGGSTPDDYDASAMFRRRIFSAPPHATTSSSMAFETSSACPAAYLPRNHGCERGHRSLERRPCKPPEPPMATYQYIYVMKGLTKIYPGGRKVLENIWLSFFPGAKIGVL